LKAVVTVEKFTKSKCHRIILRKSGIQYAMIALCALIVIVAVGETVHTESKYEHGDYAICILNFISM